MTVNHIVYAVGKKGEVVGKVFVPYREMDGFFPIFSKMLQKANGSVRLQKKENKVKNVKEISDAVDLVRNQGCSWRLKEYETNQDNIFKAESIVFHEV